MNNHLHQQYLETKSKFNKFSSRLQRSQEKGEFQKLSHRKQHFLVSRVRKLWEKLRILEVQLKICTAGVSLALLCMVSNVSAQDQFVYAPGKNPLPAPSIVGWEPVLADVDSDGDLDMLLTSFSYYADPRIVYYRNTGTAASPVFQEVPGSGNPFRNLGNAGEFETWNIAGMGDVDGDGDLDILSDEGYLLRNTGGSASPLFTGESAGFYPGSSDLGDIDGDGDLDVLRVNGDGTLSVLPNTGDGNNFNIDANNPLIVPVGNWVPGLDFIEFTRAVDLDGDGDLDLVFRGNVYDYYSDIFYEDFMFIAENTGTAAAPAFLMVDQADNPFTPFTSGSFRMGDLDGDGDFDALVFDYGSGIRYFELDNGTLSENRALIPGISDGIMLPLNYYVAPLFADVDGDGDPDILALDVYDDWNMVYYEYQETGQQLKYVRDDQKDFPFMNGDASIEIPYFVDMDTDGDLDVMMLSYDYYIGSINYLYFENTGTAQSPVYEAAVNNPVLVMDYGIIPSFADIDGDGDTDLFISFEVYDSGTQNWFGGNSLFENNGTAELAFTERTGNENPLDFVNQNNYPATEYIQLRFGDIDEDGDLDAAFTDYYGTIFYLENIGSKTEPSFVDKSQNGPFSQISTGYYGTINLVDMDGDGDLDLITHQYYGMITGYYENTGPKGGTGVLNHMVPEQLDLFPNPVADQLTIRMQNETLGTLTYEIVNVHGQQVTNGTIEKRGSLLEYTLHSGDLAPGVYLMRVVSGEKVYLSRFVRK